MRTVILGGGIVGVTTAYFLAKAGEDVVVLERNSGVGQGTSFANAGLISPGHSYTWASPQAPKILLKSLFSENQALRLKLVRDWRMYTWCWQFLKNCSAEKARLNTSRKARLSQYSQSCLQKLTDDEQLNYQRTSKGLLYLHRDRESFDRALENMAVLTDSGLKLEILSPQEIVEREPVLSHYQDKLAGAIFCPTDETGDAHLFTKDLYECCVRLGVKFKFDTTIQSLSATADHIEFVQTSDGRISGDRYLLALGCYAANLARPIGYRLPIYPVKGYSVTFPIGDGHDAPTIGGLDEHNLIAWARFGNRLRFTATAEFAGFDTTHKPGDFTHTVQAAKTLFPNGADYLKPNYWAGLRPMTPNGTPIVGKSLHRNLFFNLGHGHLGWTWCCGTARLATDIMLGNPLEIDMTGLTYR
jgi:D-amino-acid dehydrogenase